MSTARAARAASTQQRRGQSWSGLADAFARYAELIARQIAALEAGDAERFATLAAERDSLAGHIDALRGGDGPIAGAVDSDTAGIRRELARCAAADSALRARLGALHKQTAARIHATDRAHEGARGYINPVAHGTRIDLSL